MQIKAHYHAERKSPWEARWWVHGRMKSRFFATERERDRFIREFSKELREHGTEIFQLDKKLLRQWHEAHEIAPKADPVEMAKLWVMIHGKQEQPLMVEAVTKYLEHLAYCGRSEAYLKHAGLALRRFCAEHGPSCLEAIRPEMVKDYLQKLPFRPLSVRHHRSYLMAAFRWFVLQDWVSKNPVERVPVPKVLHAEPGILTVDETERLFAANQHEDPEICGLLALGAFAGLRSSTVERLSYEEIDFAQRGILIPAEKSKTQRRHFIEDLPENLWAWLERTPKSAFDLDPRQIRFRREQAYKRAGLLIKPAQAAKAGAVAKLPPKNCLRHSFVSYHVALHRDAGKTSLIVGHRNQAVLWQHYLGVASRADAERYFGIKPELPIR